MSAASEIPEIVIGISPFGEPDARLTAAVCQAGGLGVLDLGVGDRRAREDFARLRQWIPDGRYGVRVGAGCALGPADLAADDGTYPHTVVLGVGLAWDADALPAGCRVLAEVTSPEEAALALGSRVYGLIARGSESGGRVGELSTFVLLQRLLADPGITVPVWACGGIGPRTAAAAVIGGAAGVVLDSQLALLAEAEPGEDTAEAIRSMDGSETSVTGGQRLLRRRTPGAAPVPVGQDGFLAARFAEQWGTAAKTVAAIKDAVLDAVHAVHDGTAALLTGPGTAMCATLGTELPIAQGPMTRVSDQPGFAAAVAAEGALPFLALALANGAQTRSLLERTRAELGDRPWGVGILGFASTEIRSAQLEAVRELRPTHAILAGGRPSQAAVLEEAGIRTFVHVPSPGLLRQFYDMGVRRFVFEGAECGGHVGPRAAFPLWEAQLGVLEECVGSAPDAATGLDILFAGGIHDERSAAMVAALAAPLAARGAAVGVLMGTAYLFTEEAVELGAVRPMFQRQVVQATATALLESAPGHATRCVPSQYTQDYVAEKERLRADGVPDRRAWEELEQLNVGRLRIASKGIERVGAELLDVDERRQLAEGMFMAGDVAVLRSATTTLRELHHSVAQGAAAFHTARGAELAEQPELRALGELRAPDRDPEPAAAPLKVAVIGMACMFPGAPDLPAFWANILGGVDSITEVPADRWDQSVYYDGPDGRVAGAPGEHDLSASKWGGFLPDIPFDPLAYGIPPSSLAHIEPVQLLALEAARRALADAGYADRAFDRSRTSVIFGAESGSDLSNATALRTVLPAYLGEIPPELEEQLPRLTEDSFPGVLANVIAGRIANRLDLGGSNYTVDAACASGLAAIDLACKELTGGTSDVVLCGAADLHNGINDYLLFSSVHALSATGRSRTFDATADGTTLGEGVACVILKRLADAERDGDRVYAVIDGVGGSSDGRHLGLTAPRKEGQRAAVERAYRRAGVSPAQIGLIEAHGTGTVVGDRTELGTLTEVFNEAGAAAGACVIGSVKSQIGHTKCAAGLAGLIKTALALHTGVRPPTLHVTSPNSAWQLDSSPFAFHSEPLPWAAPAAERIAGVSAFGFGGTNFHVVMRAHEGGAPPRHSLDLWPTELLTFRGADHKAAAAEAQWLLGLLDAGDFAGRRLRDIAYTAARRAETRPGTVRIAVLADAVAVLPELLRKAIAGEHDPAEGVFLAPADPEPIGQVAVLFPGQGSQRPGMAADLLVAHPESQRYLAAGRQYADVLWPPAAFDPAVREQQRNAVTDTRIAQPGLGIAGLAAYDVLVRAGIRPDMAAGHSYGELVAFCAAGAISPETLLTLSAQRAESILAATGEGDPGTMAAVAAGADATELALKEAGLADRVVVANRNAPQQTMISGATDAVREASRLLRDAGFRVQPVPVAAAFHSPLVAGAGERFAGPLAESAVRAPEFPVWSNRTAAVHAAEPDAIRAELAAQIASPVRFTEQIEAMYAAGARIFVEAGPGTVLTGLVRKILGDRPYTAVPFESRPGAGRRGWLEALARLAVAGAPVRTGWLFHGRDVVDATVAPRRALPGWTVSGHLVRAADGTIPTGGLRPARRVPLRALEATPVTRSEDHELISAFLNSSREMVAAQRDVLLRYFGGAVGPMGYLDPAAAAGQGMPAAITGGAGWQQQGVYPPPGAYAWQGPQPGVYPPGVNGGPGYPEGGWQGGQPGAYPSGADGQPAQAYAGRQPGAEGHAPSQDAGYAAGPQQGVLAASAVPQAPAAGPEASVALTPEGIQSTVTTVISERTGYPVDMIEPGLDLEADLSIDSIKRTEIAGELARRLGGAAQALGDEELADLTQARTVAAITQWLTGHLPGEDDGLPAPGTPAGEAGPGSGTPSAGVTPYAAAEAGATGAGAAPAPGFGSAQPGTSPAPNAAEAAPGYGATAAGPAPASNFAPAAAGQAAPGFGSAHAGTAAAPHQAAAFGAPGAVGTAPAPHAIATAAPGAAQPSAAPAPLTMPGGQPPRRLVLRETELDPAGAPEALDGKRFALLGGGVVADALLVRLTGRGAHAAVFPDTHQLTDADGPFDGVFHLRALAVPEEGTAPAPVLPEAFGVLQAAMRVGPRWLVSARPAVKAAEPGAGEDPAAGLRGLFRSLAREYPEAMTRVVEVPATEETPAAETADALIAEVDAGGHDPVVLRTPAGRRGFVVAEAPELGALAARGAGPAGDGVAEAAALGLDQDAVVVLAGGARGITAGIAMALAAASRCRIELLGRTPLPAGAEDPAIAAATGKNELRALLIARRTGLTPAEIEREVRLTLAQREVADTLAELSRLGSPARYRAVDLRDSDAVHRAVKEIHTEHGRLDGVFHAAGVIEDRLFADKNAASFRNVYGTKVDGARALLEAVAELPDRSRFAVLFGSIAAVLGNRGQTDYAAANDALQTLGSQWAVRTGNRALTVHWGPWAPFGTHPGMVSPELAREYGRRGVSLIDPEEGALALLRELAWGEAAATSVVLTASEW